MKTKRTPPEKKDLALYIALGTMFVTTCIGSCALDKKMKRVMKQDFLQEYSWLREHSEDYQRQYLQKEADPYWWLPLTTRYYGIEKNIRYLREAPTK